MDLWFFLKELVMLLGCAFLMGALAQRLGQNPIVGYLLAGTIIGPLLFNAAAVNNAAELGVALLLFSIGLEFSFKRLRQMGPSALGGGLVQVLATIALTSLVLMIPLALPQALTIGALVSLSSTAVVMRMLVEGAVFQPVGAGPWGRLADARPAGWEGHPIWRYGYACPVGVRPQEVHNA